MLKRNLLESVDQGVLKWFCHVKKMEGEPDKKTL